MEGYTLPLQSDILKEAMTPISDAEILDVVRKLRQYVQALDNAYTVLDHLPKIDDPAVDINVQNVIPKINAAATDIAGALKNIENSRPYRDMLQRYNKTGVN